MGSKYPVLKPQEIIKRLESFGFKFISQKGSHMKYSDGKRVVIIPNHSEIAKGTFKSILSMANISLEGCRDGNGTRIRTAATESCNVVIFVETLETCNDDDISLCKFST